MVSDTGRNWSDQEVKALIQVWSDERICKQLESSTRKRDIFVQISSKLMQQGIERDWKQCHTKYKNLKYLYRSLQRGKTDEADSRRIMRFYDEVDAIMNRTNNGSAHDTRPADSESSSLTMLEGCEENNHADEPKSNTATATAQSSVDERTCSSDSVSSVTSNVATNTELKPPLIKEQCLDQQQRLTSELGNIIINVKPFYWKQYTQNIRYNQ